jgi:GntR family transcriptional regulator
LTALLYYGSKLPMPNDSKPVYLKLRDTIAAAILDGDFIEGQMLPSVRAFAAQQGANPLTVAKAYQLFQDSGLVEVKRGVGLFVAQGAVGRLRGTERDNFLKNIWPEVKAQMQRAGIDPVELLESA